MNKFKTGLTLAFASIAVMSQGAFAAVDGSVSAGIASLQADAVTLLADVTPLVVFIVLGLLGVSLVKKILGKAV